MEQRLLRLGDIVDDYCPRERRITNHAIVAIVEDAIRQTRCTTCDAEHVYKQGKEPVKRRKTAADDEVERGQLVAAARVAEPETPTDVILEAVSHERDEAAASPLAPETGEPEADAPPSDDDGWGWPAHRQLIRATLPRVEGEPSTPRPIPEFTMHQRPAGRRGDGFRFSQGRNGNVAGRGESGGRGGQGGGQGGDRGGGQGAGRSGRRRSPHKRSR